MEYDVKVVKQCVPFLRFDFSGAPKSSIATSFPSQCYAGSEKLSALIQRVSAIREGRVLFARHPASAIASAHALHTAHKTYSLFHMLHARPRTTSAEVPVPFSSPIVEALPVLSAIKPSRPPLNHPISETPCGKRKDPARLLGLLESKVQSGSRMVKGWRLCTAVDLRNHVDLRDREEGIRTERACEGVVYRPQPEDCPGVMLSQFVEHDSSIRVFEI